MTEDPGLLSDQDLIDELELAPNLTTWEESFVEDVSYKLRTSEFMHTALTDAQREKLEQIFDDRLG